VTAPLHTPRLRRPPALAAYALTPDSDASRATAHVPELDGLRGLAVVLTLATHWQAGVPTGIAVDGIVRHAAELGWLGVEMFFVLSGYLITGILLVSRARCTGLGRYLGRFMWRRALRIMPLYYATLVGLLVVAPLVVPIHDPAFATLRSYQAWYWLYGVNWLQAVHGSAVVGFQTGHFWSLAVEEQFYLAWPLLVWWAGPRRLPWMTLTLWSGSIGARWLVAPDVDPWRWTTPLHLDALMMGALLAWAGTTPWWPRIAKVLRTIGWPALLALGASVWVGAAAWYRTGAQTAIAITLGALLVLSVTGPESRWRAFCRVAWLRRFGTYSYCLYIVHYPLLAVLDRVVPRLGLPRPFGSTMLYGAVYGLLLVGLSVAIAAFSWKYFERPILAFKDRSPQWAGISTSEPSIAS
jgi:peptidoglycan/LPS O-acetylase OafA/YrhL